MLSEQGNQGQEEHKKRLEADHDLDSPTEVKVAAVRMLKEGLSDRVRHLKGSIVVMRCRPHTFEDLEDLTKEIELLKSTGSGTLIVQSLLVCAPSRRPNLSSSSLSLETKRFVDTDNDSLGQSRRFDNHEVTSRISTFS